MLDQYSHANRYMSIHQQFFCEVLFDQVYSKTRVLTQVNTSQHESTRVNTSPTRVNTNQHEFDTSQHESTRVQNRS